MQSPILKLIVLVSICLICWLSTSGDISASTWEASDDSYLTVMVRSADIVIVGSVVQLLRSDCAASGLAASRQGIEFNVKEVLKGHVERPGKVTAHHFLMGGDPLEIVVDGCIQLAPQIFTPGREFIVACRADKSILPNGGWAIIGGPWPYNTDKAKLASRAIAEGDVGLPQEIWLKYESDVERFLAGGMIPSDRIERAISFFDRLTNSQSTERGKVIALISKSVLQDDLAAWKAWYRQHGHSLSWDARKLIVVIKEDDHLKKKP